MNPHPYAGGPSGSTSSLGHHTHTPLPPDYESRRRSIMGSEHDSATAFVSSFVVPPPSHNKPDTPLPGAAPASVHGCPYVKHSSGITLLLSGHKAGASIPFYPSGSLMSGMVVLANPSRVTSFDAKLVGSISVREVQGGGRSTIVFFADQLITWEATATGTSLPDDFSFHRTLPAFSDGGSLLPPTFDSRLSAIPGFRVSVNWSVVITVTRKRTTTLSLFRRTTRLSVPIEYIPRTRPPGPGPFPMSSSKSSPSIPRTSFVDLVPSKKEHTPPILAQIYLPHSQIMPMTEPILFRIVLSAPDTYLKSFLTVPSHSSFLQLGGAAAATPASSESSCAAAPVCVQLVRRIKADPRETCVVVVGELSTSVTQGAVLAEAVLGRAETGQCTVSWWGELRVPLDRASPGGFVAERLVVQDELVLTLNVPCMHTHLLPFRQVVPMRLTTDLPGTIGALSITEV